MATALENMKILPNAQEAGETKTSKESSEISPAERWIFQEIQKLKLYDEKAANLRRKAMAGIAERFHQRVYRYCLSRLSSHREEAEDVVQEVFQDLEKMLLRVQDEQHLRNLIFSVSRNKCVDAIERIRRAKLAVSLDSLAPLNETEEEGIDPTVLRNAIKNLPKRDDRILLTLSLDYRLSTKQVAEVLEITEGACKMRRHRARLKLREMLENESAE